MLHKVMGSGSLLVLSLSLLSQQTQAAPVVADAVAAEVATTYGAAPQTDTDTTPNSGGTAYASVFRYENQQVLQGTSRVNQNGNLYLSASSHYDVFGGPCNPGDEVECEEPTLSRLSEVAPLVDPGPVVDPGLTVERLATDVRSSAGWSMSVENTSTQSMDFELDFHIPNSSIDLFTPILTDYPTVDLDMISEVGAEILLDGVVIWSFSYELTVKNGLLEFSQDGLGTVPFVDPACVNNNYCQTTSFNGNLELGTLAGGSAALLEYNAWTHVASAAYTLPALECDLDPETCSMDQYAQFGDPANINSNGPTLTNAPTTPPTDVPEPSLLGLFGLALAGMVFYRRRKNI